MIDTGASQAKARRDRRAFFPPMSAGDGCILATSRRALCRATVPVRMFAFFLVLSLLFKASLVEAFFIPSTSMAPTLHADDYILVPKFLYGLHLPLVEDVLVKWSKPSRGDVVVFRRGAGPGPHGDTLVKRVIALEGDVVEVMDKEVYLNGKLLLEPYVQWIDGARRPLHSGPYRVPTGKVFVLGDNRDASEDSRVWQDPFVSESQVLGKAILVYWSGAKVGGIGTVL